MNYMVGDRVISKQAYWRIPPGVTGTVVRVIDDERLSVEWDVWIGGHSCEGRCSTGYGGNLPTSYVCLLDSPVTLSDEDMDLLLTERR